MDTLQVVHAIPGRVRFRLGPEALALNLEDFLQVDGVGEVVFNETTKSILMLYDAQVPLESLLSGIEEQMSPLGIVREDVRARTVTGENRLGQAISGSVAELDGSINAATGGAVSGTSLFPLSLIALGAIQVITIEDGVMPPWWALMWWGFNIFRGWHKRSEAGVKSAE